MNPLMNPVGSNAEGKLNCINAVVITQIRTVILIQSVSGLRFLIFMLKHCVCGTFAPSGPKRKPGQVVFWSGFCLCVGFVVLAIVERA